MIIKNRRTMIHKRASLPLIETGRRTSMIKEDIWQELDFRYELLNVIGEGSFGQVRKAKCRHNGSLVAIKLIRNAFANRYEAKKLLREVQILRKLSSNENNIYCSKLLDIVIAEPQNDYNFNNIGARRRSTDFDVTKT